MQALIEEFELPETLDAAAFLSATGGRLTVYLKSCTGDFDSRYSILASNPMLVLHGRGREYKLWPGEVSVLDPWATLEDLLGRFFCELQTDLGLPAGGCFGYWGYHMKDLVEPGLRPCVLNTSREPDCCLGFYSSLVAQDHQLGKTWIISTGLDAHGRRTEEKAKRDIEAWRHLLDRSAGASMVVSTCDGAGNGEAGAEPTVGREEFIRRVLRTQAYIRSGDIYQVNLSYPFEGAPRNTWDLFQALNARSPAPFSAWLKAPDFEIASSSPEQFLRMSGSLICTRPIKGTRARSLDQTRDAQLAHELQTSPKENAELLMITDLLRNDMGKVCEFGSVLVPQLARLERFSHVQHLVSTVEGRLRPDLSHSSALKACFPGGSITGAPKFRAMQIIDEIERASRGCYTGALGYIGFNRESQLSIIIRTAVKWRGKLRFDVGAGIVADSEPGAEYDETLAKARGFMDALKMLQPGKRTPEAPL